jgi:hypothetical protein
MVIITLSYRVFDVPPPRTCSGFASEFPALFSEDPLSSPIENLIPP